MIDDKYGMGGFINAMLAAVNFLVTALVAVVIIAIGAIAVAAFLYWRS